MARHPAAFINNIADEGSKDEAVKYLQETWDELMDAKARIAAQATHIAELEKALDGANQTIALFMGPDGEKQIEKFAKAIKTRVNEMQKYIFVEGVDEAWMEYADRKERAYAAEESPVYLACEVDARIAELEKALQAIATLEVGVNGVRIEPGEWMRDIARTAIGL